MEKVFAAFVEALADRDLSEKARRRLAQKDQAVEVNVDTL
jgi:antitoxin StbD